MNEFARVSGEGVYNVLWVLKTTPPEAGEPMRRATKNTVTDDIVPDISDGSSVSYSSLEKLDPDERTYPAESATHCQLAGQPVAVNSVVLPAPVGRRIPKVTGLLPR